MLLGQIAAIQIASFILFFTLERLYPNQKKTPSQRFNLWLLALVSLGGVWLKLLVLAWPFLDQIGLNLKLYSPNVWIEGALFYLIYSCGNYWMHRIKHSNRWLWHYVHTLHHQPQHMDTRVALFRHPSEMLFNSVYLVVLSQIIFNVSLEAVALALVIEGSLEAFHHSNIRLPRWLRCIGVIVQTPEMHLVHHQKGWHRGNYSPFLWDAVFGTLQRPESSKTDVGFKNSSTIEPFLLFRNRR